MPSNIITVMLSRGDAAAGLFVVLVLLLAAAAPANKQSVAIFGGAVVKIFRMIFILTH